MLSAMRVHSYSMRGWKRNLGPKRVVLLAVVGLLTIAALGGGAYAALGGPSRQQTSSDIELQRGLVGHWKLDGNAKDSTPNAINGNLVGSPASVADRKGKANAAYTFSNTASYATFDNDKFPTSAMTISFWSKQTALINWSNLFNNQWTLVNGSWSIHVDSRRCANIWDLSRRNSVYRLLLERNDFDEYMVSLCRQYDGTTVNLYVKELGRTTCARRTATISAVSLRPGQAHPLIMGYAGTGNTFTNDDARVYDRA